MRLLILHTEDFKTQELFEREPLRCQRNTQIRSTLAHVSVTESTFTTVILETNQLVKIEEPEDKTILNPMWGMNVG
jgi:hypothetical protein